MSDRDPSVDLSMAASELLAALERAVGGASTSAASWLVALLDRDRLLAEGAAEGRDLAALEAAARSAGAADEGDLLDRADVEAGAGARAARSGSPVAGTGSVAGAIVDAFAMVQAAPVQTTTAEVVVPPPAAAPADQEPLPLSLGAGRLAASLLPPGGERGLFALVVALVEEHADVVTRTPVENWIVAEVATRARELLALGDEGPPWTAERVAAAASSVAASLHRPIVTPADVTLAVFEAAEPALHAAVIAHGPAERDVGAVTEQQATPPPEEEPVSSADQVRAAPAAAGRARMFRLFVSSTFDDFELERDVLREHVWPRLTTFCEQRGARFQAIDLRWGVSSEATTDQRTMDICLGEIDRCHRVTPRPNFLVLVGDHHGWEPLPPHVPAAEFDRLLEHLPDDDRREAAAWYETDLNAKPPERRLRPRTAELEDDAVWAPVERRLHTALANAAQAAGLGEDRLRVYQASATEQEIALGAMEAGDPDQVLCVLRHIELPADAASREAGIVGYDPARFVDRDAAPLDALRARLRERLGERILGPEPDAAPGTPFTVSWGDPYGGLEYLDRLADGVATMLEASIAAELRAPRRPPGPLRSVRRSILLPSGLDPEGRAHHDFAEERIRVFVGREPELRSIEGYLDGDMDRPLVVTGGGGTGKSALVAEAVRLMLERRADELVVYRFVGATPGSSDVRTLLEGVCRELARRTGGSEQDVPSDFRDLVTDFHNRFRSPSGKRVTVVLDSLDQLSAADGGRSLSWVPAVLPAGARLLLSTRPGDTLEPLVGRSEKLDLPPLATVDGRAALAQLLEDAGRDLQRGQADEVMQAFERSNGNPLYLRLAFEEARRWTFDPDGPDRPHPPLAVAQGSESDVVGPVIRENLFDRLRKEHGDVLVARALGYLAASRFGLTESELLDLLSADSDVYRWFVLGSFHLPPDLVALVTRSTGLAAGSATDGAPTSEEQARGWLADAVAAARNGTDSTRLDGLLDDVLGRPEGPSLPVVLWSRLYFDLEPYLVERQVDDVIVLDFYHRELRDVAATEYVHHEPGRVLHDRLARYFERRADPVADRSWEGPDGYVDIRGLAELPYHLTAAERWDDVVETLTDFAFLEHKVAHVGVNRRGGPDGESLLYAGVFRLQGDFDLALERMPGDDREGERRIRPIVTAVDLGEGLVVHCPHCNTWHPFREEWRGREIECPAAGCGGPLKVNPFVSERT